jgi:hypothetical protein
MTVRVEGRFLLYSPTIYPSHEVQEWGGRWNKKEQYWRLPRLTVMARKIKAYDPDAKWSPDAKRLLQDWEARDVEVFSQEAYHGDIQHPTEQHLYDFQKIALSSLVTRPYHGELLALTPGLGKTPTSIVAGDIFMKENGGSHRALVVCPLSLTRNWVRELQRWSACLPGDIEVVHQEDPRPDRSIVWTVTNYDSILERIKNDAGRTVVTGNLKEGFDLDWDVVIFDESVLLKNRKAKRVSAAKTLAHRAKRVWLLSGAPVVRDNSDIWSQFNIMEPDYFTSFWRFANEYCVVVQTPWSQGEILGSRQDADIRGDFPDLMFVRNQDEVFPELPEYIFKDVMLDLHPKQRKAHDDIMTAWLHELEENKDKRVEVTAVIAMLIRLQQVTSNLYNLETTGTSWPDYSVKADYVEELLDTGSSVEWPVLIWMHHRPGAQALLDRLRKRTKKKDSALYERRVELVLGGMGARADELIEEYKAGEVDVLLLGIGVGKYGHTLVHTQTMVTYDKSWDSDAWFQMLHRVRRHGLKHSPLVINPRCMNSVDTFVELNLAGKIPAMAKLTGSQLARILRSLGEEYE